MAILIRRRVRVGTVGAFVILGELFGVGAVAQSSKPVEEYRVKAALIYSLVKFVEWPATAFPDAGARLTICVVGSDPFGPALEGETDGHTVAGRRIAIRRLVAFEPGCHVVFVSLSEARRVPVILEQLRGQSVLTVGDDQTFLDRGGMVAFYKKGDNVRFDISTDAAEQARLKVSARVMAVVNRLNGATP